MVAGEVAASGNPEHTYAPEFLRLAAHPLRWWLLTELSQSDRQVHELTELIGRPQNLVSYHLGRLRKAELVRMRRSSADARDAYYSIDLLRCGDLLARAGSQLHPALQPQFTDLPSAHTPFRKVRVLFLCTGNSARSQIAEALMQHLAPDVEACSAGSQPKMLHPNAIRVMAARGIDLRGRRAKHVAEFLAEKFDYVITLCDRVREICPEFPAHPELIHWSIADPSAGAVSDEECCAAFERTATELEMRIGFFLHVVRANSVQQVAPA
jgi:ArsR family transcriptional regulator, arsenate/arsenite/antimonite-responsive transcriptional repressor / arsenate reductase (thioredoxin)